MQVVLIGTGNTATVLGRLIKNAGHQVLQVWGRTQSTAASLAAELDTSFSVEPAGLHQQADLYIIAVSDTAIETLANTLPLPHRTIVHTAGSVSREVLAKAAKNYGVLYPYQSLRKEISEQQQIPFLIDGNTPDDLAIIHDFARSLSPLVQQAGDIDRAKYHLAAIITNNFSNHLYTLAEDYCRNAGIQFNLLFPLLQQLPDRLQHTSPRELQTGPAIRNDLRTIDRHRELLSELPALKGLYELFTQSITEYYNKKKNPGGS